MSVVPFKPQRTGISTDQRASQFKDELGIYVFVAVILAVGVLAGYMLWAKV